MEVGPGDPLWLVERENGGGGELGEEEEEVGCEVAGAATGGSSAVQLTRGACLLSSEHSGRKVTLR